MYCATAGDASAVAEWTPESAHEASTTEPSDGVASCDTSEIGEFEHEEARAMVAELEEM